MRVLGLSGSIPQSRVERGTASIEDRLTIPNLPGRRLLLYVLLVVACAFAVYAWGAAPGLLWGDSAEMQLVGLKGGIPHATGYPGYVLSARLLGSIPIGEPAHRLTLVTALFAALTLGMMTGLGVGLGLTIGSAALAAVLLGASITFWQAAQRAEVYSFSLCLEVLALWRTIVAMRSPRFRDAALAGFLIGLSLTGHLSFIFAAAGLGLALAWHVARMPGRAIPSLVALLGAFLLGLLPYLYILWADTHPVAYNYLHLVEVVQSPLGRPLRGFETPLERLGWLITAQNTYPPMHTAIDPRVVARNLIVATIDLFAFELGPLALVFALIGAVGLWARRRSDVVILGLALALSLFFSTAIGNNAMMQIYLMPSVAVLALFTAAGIEALLGRFASRGAALAVVWIVVALAVLVPPQLIRVATYDHPLGPWRVRVEEEEASAHRGFLPSMRGNDEPRRFTDRALEIIPKDALVLATWTELVPLLFRQIVDHRRTDLTIQPASWETLPRRLAVWQGRHDLTARPLVFVGAMPQLSPYGARFDSLDASGVELYVQRTPLRGLPTP